MVAVTIIGILLTIAYPSYKRYVNEARATELLVRIHSISLGYLDASYDDYKESTSNVPRYDSEKMGQAPSALASLDYLYSTTDGFQMASYVLSKNNYFNYLITQSTPVVLVHATDNKSLEILQALSHVMQWNMHILLQQR